MGTLLVVTGLISEFAVIKFDALQVGLGDLEV